MRFLAIITTVLIHLYLVADVNGKSSKKTRADPKLDSNIATEAAKAIKLFDSGRFQEALTVFSRSVDDLVNRVHVRFFLMLNANIQLIDSGVARETRMFLLRFITAGDIILSNEISQYKS
jgi:hypothetical protein